jgi:hypothetical protein
MKFTIIGKDKLNYYISFGKEYVDIQNDKHFLFSGKYKNIDWESNDIGSFKVKDYLPQDVMDACEKLIKLIAFW